MCGVAQTLSSQWFGIGSNAGTANVILTGSYRLLGQASNRQGSFQQKPPDFARAELSPTLVVLGIPITASILYSSEQGAIRQEINAYSLNIDPSILRSVIERRAFTALDAYMSSASDSIPMQEGFAKLQEYRTSGAGTLTDYTGALEELGLISTVERIMLWMPKIGYGTVFPTLTPLTLNGARVSGLQVEWNPGEAFYLNIVHGTTQRPLTRTDVVVIDTTLFDRSSQDDFGRRITAARLGFGSPHGNHVMITGVYATDDVGSLPGGDTTIAPPPQRNILGGLDLRLSPIPSVWTIEAEVVGSVTVGDLNAPRIHSSDVPAFVLNLIDSSSAVFTDWSATAATQLNIASSGTRLNASLRRIGTGFRALGVPNMRVDVLRYDARVNQSLFKRQVSAGVFVRQDRDNLVPLKRATTITTSLGFELSLLPRKLPYVRVSYLPYLQETNTTDSAFAYQNRTHMWSASSGYAYQIGDVSSNTQLTYSLQAANSTTDGSDYTVTSINAYQSGSFVIPLTISAGVGLIQQRTADQHTNIITIDGSGAYTLSDILAVNGGLQLALDRGSGDRIGFSLGVTAHIEDVADIDIRAERALFQEYVNPALLGGSYQENIVRVVVSKSW